MNPYQIAVESRALPDGFEARLRTRVLAESARQPNAKPYRLRSFAQKMLATALIALTLLATLGAAVIAVRWDRIFIDRFGNDQGAASLGETAFQDVNVSSVCGDITLTIRQALGDTNTIYMILDIALPAHVPMAEALAAAQSDDGANLIIPAMRGYATGEISWEDIQGKTYEQAETALQSARFPGGGFIGVEEKDYDPLTNTMTFLVSLGTDSKSKKLTDQPLTLLVGGMRLEQNGRETTLFEGPLLITFEPAYTAQATTLPLIDAEGNIAGEVMISPFALSAQIAFTQYAEFDEFYRDITLVYRDGSTGLPQTMGYGGGDSKPMDKPFYTTLSIRLRFRKILELGDVVAVRIGDYEARVK